MSSIKIVWDELRTRLKIVKDFPEADCFQSIACLFSLVVVVKLCRQLVVSQSQGINELKQNQNNCIQCDVFWVSERNWRSIARHPQVTTPQQQNESNPRVVSHRPSHHHDQADNVQDFFAQGYPNLTFLRQTWFEYRHSMENCGSRGFRWRLRNRIRVILNFCVWEGTCGIN